jgi:hypothetical protein
MILFDDTCAEDLDVKAQEFFLFLNPRDENTDELLEGALILKIEDKRDNPKNVAERNLVRFWNYLLNPADNILESLIISRPDELKRLFGEILDEFGDEFFSRETNYENARLTEEGKVVKAVFNYYDFFRGQPEYVEHCRNLHVPYCPYCNEVPIPLITLADGVESAINQLDHFYPKSRHPYLSLSFFNLVPSCEKCNGPQIKKEKRFDINTHFNPFHSRLDDYFAFVVEDLLVTTFNEIEISYLNRNPHPINSIVDFELIERYNATHKEPAYNLIQNIRRRSPRIRGALLAQFAEIWDSARGVKETMLERNGVKTNVDEVLNINIGKLKRDIALQMGINLD